MDQEKLYQAITSVFLDSDGLSSAKLTDSMKASDADIRDTMNKVKNIKMKMHTNDPDNDPEARKFAASLLEDFTDGRLVTWLNKKVDILDMGDETIAKTHQDVAIAKFATNRDTIALKERGKVIPLHVTTPREAVEEDKVVHELMQDLKDFKLSFGNISVKKNTPVNQELNENLKKVLSNIEDLSNDGEIDLEKVHIK